MNQINYSVFQCRLSPKFRPLLRFPHKSNLEFPARERGWKNEYMALIKPWLGGVRAYWIESLQAFQLENGHVVRVSGIEPDIPDGIGDLPAQNVLGEFYEKHATYEETLARVLSNTPTPNLDFNIFDADLDYSARDRATYCLQIPIQNDRHVRIVQMYEVMTPGGFRTWLDTWKGSLFEGALAVGSDDPWLATEYEVKVLLPDLPPTA